MKMTYNYQMKEGSSPEGKGNGTLLRNRPEIIPVTSEEINRSVKKLCFGSLLFSVERHGVMIIGGDKIGR